MNDREILDRLRAGGHDAFEAIFRAQYAQLVVVSQAILRDRARAEDVAQDVLLELWRRRESIVVETSIRAYLIRAVRNRALNEIRHQRVADRVDPANVESRTVPLADAELKEREIEAAVRDAVRTLPDRCREVFELSRTQGLKYAEIAEVMEISVKTVEAQMGKTMKVLREKLAQWLTP